MTHVTLSVENCTWVQPQLLLAVRAESCLHVDMHFHLLELQTWTRKTNECRTELKGFSEFSTEQVVES